MPVTRTGVSESCMAELEFRLTKVETGGSLESGPCITPPSCTLCKIWDEMQLYEPLAFEEGYLVLYLVL